MEWKCFHWEIMWRYSSGTEFKRTLEWSEMDQGPIALLNVRWQRNLGQGIFISQKSYKSRCAAVKTDFNCLWHCCAPGRVSPGGPACLSDPNVRQKDVTINHSQSVTGSPPISLCYVVFWWLDGRGSPVDWVWMMRMIAVVPSPCIVPIPGLSLC